MMHKLIQGCSAVRRRVLIFRLLIQTGMNSISIKINIQEFLLSMTFRVLFIQIL